MVEILDIFKYNEQKNEFNINLRLRRRTEKFIKLALEDLLKTSHLIQILYFSYI